MSISWQSSLSKVLTSLKAEVENNRYRLWLKFEGTPDALTHTIQVIPYHDGDNLQLKQLYDNGCTFPSVNSYRLGLMTTRCSVTFCEESHTPCWCFGQHTPPLVFSQPSIYIDGWLYGIWMTSVVCNVPVLSQNDSTYHHSVFTTWKWHPFATWTPSFIIL